MPFFPETRVWFNRLAGSQAFQSQIFEFVFRLLVGADNPLDVRFNRQALGRGAGAKPRFQFCAKSYTHVTFCLILTLW
jgi:hypothetical protein